MRVSPGPTRRIPVLTGVFLILTGTLLSACQRELHFDPADAPGHNIQLHFKAVVQDDTEDMVFGSSYTNAFNESFQVDQFKFYVHAIQLINTDSGKVFQVPVDQYYLVNFRDSASCVLPITVPSYKYNRLAFMLGVDSARNVSGAQTGALDPLNGMFWTWNTGYIMAKLEGQSPVSTAPGHAFEYHIGGFRQADNVVRQITLLFPYGDAVDMQPNGHSSIHITADVLAWFKNPHDIKISTNPTCMTPGTLAMQIAENYAKMFTVTSIHNE
ncbi:MAG: hypothetical protein P0Y53_02730 [Candidatus Pseudobacter hemicellulosilyticus]|uniref:Copper-binding protein MbnP-like domain-containing protein n=1 Tax=Candidatus Pseudobacter hemicellulosilyticus TaxID=3121375 RepID=A0AAJ5WVL9_9BACT|nr:MAG: hypothetical protein P0Y53_02730 [Pseudobacter sp.]